MALPPTDRSHPSRQREWQTIKSSNRTKDSLHPCTVTSTHRPAAAHIGTKAGPAQYISTVFRYAVAKKGEFSDEYRSKSTDFRIVLACWEASMQAVIPNTVATASNFTRRGRFYHSNVFSVFCHGLHLFAAVLVLVYTQLRKLIHPHARVEVAAFLQSVLVHFVGLVSNC